RRPWGAHGLPGGSASEYRSRGPQPGATRRHRVARNRWSLVGLALVTLLILAAIAAPGLAGDPTAGELSAALRSPSTANLLGTDAQGRDVLSRVLFGARLSLAVGLTSQVIALTAGLALGLVAGFYGRWLDALVMRVA